MTSAVPPRMAAGPLPGPVRRGLDLERIEHAIAFACEIACAALVVVEIFLLLSAVFGRYVLHKPLPGADEIASILLLWMGSLGSVVALRRGEHMRMTSFVKRLPPTLSLFVEEFVAVATLTVLALMTYPAAEYVYDEFDTVTLDLALPSVWRTSAILAGVVLMLVVACTRLLRTAHKGIAASFVAAILLLCGLLWLCAPLFAQLGNLNLVVFFVFVLAACVFAALPIAFAFAASTLGYLMLATDVQLQTMIGLMSQGMSHLMLLAIPMFVFLGYLIDMTGLAGKMVAFLIGLIGHLRGGLSYVLIAAMYLVSGISGSKAADMAAVTPVLLPEMKKRGAKPGELIALMASTAAQTETVPPSLALIILGSVTSVSIGALFTGGLVPSAVLAIALCAVVYFRNRKEDLSQVVRPTGIQLRHLAFAALPGIALPFVIRGAVVGGVATATEVSAIGIAYAAILGLIGREFAWRRLVPMLVDTAVLSGAILLIMGITTAMAWALTQSGFSTALANAMQGLPGGAITFLLVSALAFMVLGTVLEGLPAIVLFAPLLFPIAKQVGVHEVHYAMVSILAMGIALFCPPFGVGYYVACAIGRVDPDEGMKPIGGYAVAMLVGLVVVIAVPWLSTCFLN